MQDSLLNIDWSKQLLIGLFSSQFRYLKLGTNHVLPQGNIFIKNLKEAIEIFWQ